MRFVVIVKANKETEAGGLPSEQLVAEMSKYNEQLVNAGIMLGGEGLHSSAKGARVTFKKDKRIVTDGPFTETKELIAGFWIWQTKSLKEAIDWARKCQNPTGDEGQLEIRQVMELDDFKHVSPEVIEHEKQVHAKARKLAASKH